jgi:hypothetical protein
MYGIEIGGLNGARKEVDKVHSIFCKKKQQQVYQIAQRMDLWKWNLAGRVGEAVFKKDFKILVSCYVFRDGRTNKTML